MNIETHTYIYTYTYDHTSYTQWRPKRARVSARIKRRKNIARAQIPTRRWTDSRTPSELVLREACEEPNGGVRIKFRRLRAHRTLSLRRSVLEQSSSRFEVFLARAQTPSSCFVLSRDRRSTPLYTEFSVSRALMQSHFFPSASMNSRHNREGS